MALVYLGIGSNIEREQTIAKALKQLATAFDELQISPTFESEAVGFNGDNFYNLVASVTTEHSLVEVIAICKRIEDACGRQRTGPKFSSRTIDIDILLYDDLVCQHPIVLPREEVLENAYVLWPLALLAPDLIHPTEQKTMQAIWQNFEHNQKLWQVDIAYQ
jgi:2-amino-4-hydroxy-6-hydroxymethyldihydropteridine diphosphokinase